SSLQSLPFRAAPAYPDCSLMTKPKTYIPYYDDIIQSMATCWCTFCVLLLVGADTYIDAMLLVFFNDPRVRREQSAASDLCRSHAWLLVRPGSALSSAIIYQDVVRTAARVVGTTPAEGRLSLGKRLAAFFRRRKPVNDALLDALRPQQSCPVCA